MRYSAKTLFYFQKLNNRVKTGTLRALYRVAGLIRTSSKRNLRIRKGSSNPGKPPHAHTRGGLRVIHFAVDRQAQAALIGPYKFPGSTFFDSPVPHIHEFGGTYLSRLGIWTYPERSYMGYTLKRLIAAGKIPRQFSASLAEVL